VKLKVVIAVVIAVLVLWGVVATVLWATGERGPYRVETVTVETP
jgi:hypothetical protein